MGRKKAAEEKVAEEPPPEEEEEEPEEDRERSPTPNNLTEAELDDIAAAEEAEAERDAEGAEVSVRRGGGEGARGEGGTPVDRTLDSIHSRLLSTSPQPPKT